MRGSWLLLPLVLSVALAACGSTCPDLFASSASSSGSSSSGGAICVAGLQTACECPGGRMGAQRCAVDGSGFGACFGCGAGGGGGSAGTGCFDYASFDGKTPAVTFKTDVLPVFRQSCGLSTSCHGDPNGGVLPGQRYYGPATKDPAPTVAQLQAIFDASISKPASANPDMDVIKPGDPAHSFLMYKLDADPVDGMTCSALTCAMDGTCLATMPTGGPRLPAATRDTIRKWIAQGAQND